MKMLLRLYTQRWKMVQYVLHSVCVRTIRQQLLTVSSGSHTRTLTDIHIPYKNTQYISTAHTHCHNSHVLQSWVVNLLQFLYSNFDTIVLQTVLPVDVLCGEEILEEEGEMEGDTTLGGEDEQPKRTLSTIYLIPPWKVVSLIDVQLYH